MIGLKLNIENVYPFIPKETVFGFKDQVKQHIDALHNKTGAGSDFVGWVNLPSSISDDQIREIEQTADELQKKIDVIVVIGIGGSYLGAKAITCALEHNFVHLKEKHDAPHILFAGQNIGEDYHSELLEILEEKRYAVIVISKSGTTTEPAIAFRLLKNHLEKKVGKDEAKSRIIAITGKDRGALRQLAINEGYKTFVIPDDVGGRYSVLTPVGLLPIAVAGYIRIRTRCSSVPAGWTPADDHAVCSSGTRAVR